MAEKKTIIVVGGSHGGPNAAAKARQFNEHAQIIMVEQAPLVTWSQASLKYHLMNDDELVKTSMTDQDGYFRKRYNIEVKNNTRAVSLDVDSHCLVIDCQGVKERLSYGSLVFAGGAESLCLEIPMLSGPRVVNFRKPQDIFSVKRAIKEGAKHALVVGCGFYGVDAAISLKKAGLEVSVIESKKRIMPRFSLQFAQAILDKLNEEGIAVKLDATIASAERLSSGGFRLLLSSYEEIDVDLVVVCIGIKPRTSLLAEAGAALDPEGLVRVDDFMATTLPNVFACGSAVSVPYAVSSERKWIPQPAIIQRTAQIAGRNAATDTAERDFIKPFCGTLIIDVGDTSFARTGLNEAEARELLGDENVLVTTVFGSSVESFVYQQEMCVKLITDRAKRRIIGGEVFGKSGVLRRIDLLSVAVLEGFAPERLIDIDMAYLANSGPIFDPLKDAAMRASISLTENTQIMSAEMLALWLKNEEQFQLVDVGEAPKLSGRLPKKAKHVPLESLRERMNELIEDDMPIVLYSKSGHRSYLAQQALVQRGLRNVYHLDGGIATFYLVAKKD